MHIKVYKSVCFPWLLKKVRYIVYIYINVFIYLSVNIYLQRKKLGSIQRNL